ncbi:unnamed protein product, partial [Iphiclides podalirius]
MQNNVPYLISNKTLKPEFNNLEKIQISSEDFSIGRGLKNSVVIPFLAISRSHCIIRKTNDNAWFIEDYSSCGIEINGVKLGEKSAVEKQKAFLIEERDKQLTIVTNEMQGKISELMEQIKKHNEAESELIAENKLLKDKLLQERQEFLEELNKESSSKQDLLNKLEAKIHEQEEIRLKEKNELERTLQIEMERLKVAKEQELRELEEQKKSRELELLQELNELKKNLEAKMEQTEQQKSEIEQVLNNQMEQMRKVNDEEKVKMEKLINEREELQKQLTDAQANAHKSIIELETRVQDRETELAALAAERIQKHAEQSTEVINSLLEQLERVKNQLKTVETEKEILKAESGESSKKKNTVAEFTDIMENELQCSICAELFIVATTLNCSHTFCKYCITKWKKKKNECPICRTAITSECKSLVLDSFIEKMVENLSDEMKQKRMNVLKSRKELEVHVICENMDQNDGGSSSSTSDIEYQSDFSELEQGEEEGEGEEDEFEDYILRDYWPQRRRGVISWSDSDSGPDVDYSLSAGSASGSSSADDATPLDEQPSGATAVPDNAGSGGRGVVPGIPGSFYGGYGRCYKCGACGHWAPGCPTV